MLKGRVVMSSENIVSLSRYDRGDGKGEYLNKELNYLKYRLGLGSGPTIAFITDTHFAKLGDVDTQWGWNEIRKNFSIYDNSKTKNAGVYKYNAKYIQDRLERATAVLLKLSETTKIDAVVLGGDDAQGTISRADYLSITEEHSNILAKLSRRMPVLPIKGNHDLNSFGNWNNGIRVATPSQYANAINKYLSFSPSVVYGDALKTYGYVDYSKQKIRVIYLNIYDYDTSTEYAFGFAGKWFLGQSQLSWLVNVAFDLGGKTNWKVVIACHAAISHSASRALEAYNPTYGNNFYKLLISFQHKLSGRITNTDTTDIQFNVDVPYDFGGMDSSNKILCIVCGHVHQPKVLFGYYYYDTNGIDLNNRYASDGVTVIGTNRYYISCITVESVGQPSGKAGGTTSSERDYIANYDIGVEDAIFDVLQFDLSNNVIYCHHYGIGDSRKLAITPSNGTIRALTKTITVTVHDGSNNIASATVSLKFNGATITATTNSSGVAIFTVMPYDKFTLNVTASGYDNYSEQIDDINLTSKTVQLTINS